MSLLLRRTLSWLAALAVITGIALALPRLPGWNGITEELEWILSHDPHTREFNRASTLIMEAETARRGEAARLAHVLLRRADNNVVENTLRLVHDFVSVQQNPRGPLFGAALGAAMTKEFRAWIVESSPETKLRHCERAVRVLFVLDWLRGVPVRPTEQRWVLAATTARSRNPRMDALLLLFRSGRGEEAGRIALLDGEPVDANLTGLERIHPSNEAFLLASLSDPAPRVRWAAGRILAVCRDERGLPAVYDWLTNDPKAPPSARRVITELFGADWSKPFESGGAASQPGAGDGR